MLKPFDGIGLGLRTEFIDEIIANDHLVCDFFEIAPENYIGKGGMYKKRLQAVSERYPIICHGLSLSLGGQRPFSPTFLNQLKDFFTTYDIRCYSEHLSYCTDESGELYDLMPIPFTEEAIKHVVGRINKVQDVLGFKIAIENVSYYCAPAQALSEIDFLLAILEEADCELLLDVNNVFVNSVNHQYDAINYLNQIPFDRVRYIHVAGHYRQSEDLIIDTHGADVIEDVWALLKYYYQHHGFKPTLLERDFNVPPLEELLKELTHIDTLKQSAIKQQKETVLC